MILGQTKDEEEVFAVGFPFKRKEDYFDDDFKRPITKDEIRWKKRHKSMSNQKPRTEPAESGFKKRWIVVSKNHVDHLEYHIEKEIAEMKNESV